MSTATTSKVHTALVIGGGIAGPVVATALLKAGIQATVYEAYPTLAEGIGGGLALAPNGLAALGLIGADDSVRALATPITAGNTSVAEINDTSMTITLIVSRAVPPGQSCSAVR